MDPSLLPSEQQLRLLRLLADRFPNVAAAHAEMINLTAILALPRGTDHYVSDIHGAYDQFDHILRHASGTVANKVEETFGINMTQKRKTRLINLICYPRKSLRWYIPQGEGEERNDWMVETVAQLVAVARTASRKYTRSKIRKRLPVNLAYVMEELLTQGNDGHRESYYNTIIRSIIDMGEGENFIIALGQTIQALVNDRLIVLGDVYDRGPAAEKVMDRLIAHHQVEMLWGNHDIIWMGAAAGSAALCALVTRISLRYGNLPTLEGAYDISMKRLAEFAGRVYDKAPVDTFMAKAMPSDDYPSELLARMHKAISIIQFKLEEQIIRRHPEYEMHDRLLLERIDLSAGTINLYGQTYPLLDAHLPTLDPANPSALSPDEQEIVDDLVAEFRESRELQRHVQFLYTRGSMFRLLDGNLLYHGCLPVDEDGNFVQMQLDGQRLGGPDLLARFEKMARNGMLSRDPATREAGQDAMWYLWNGKHSPLFGKARMTTLERYFVADKVTHKEPSTPYYKWRHDEAFCRKVLAAFGADDRNGLIINGHTPVKVSKGESPILGNGRMIVIDGGMSEAYQKETGIAGYTLIHSSRGVTLAEHDAYSPPEELIEKEVRLAPRNTYLQRFTNRVYIRDTDVGRQLRGQLEDLQHLIDAYRDGLIPEQR